MKKCPMCKKDYEAGVKSAYKLGKMDGEDQTKRTFNVMAAANRSLWDELVRLDSTKPLNGAPGFVKVPVELVEKIIPYINKSKGQHLTRRLKNLLSDHRRKNLEIVDRLLDEHRTTRKTSKDKGG